VTDAEGKNEAAPGPVGGAPAGPPAADEFAAIPSRRSRSPVLAVAAILLAAFLGFKVRRDVAYALSDATPVDLGDARALAAKPADALPLNRYVRISGLPDRESAVILDTQGSWTFGQFFRLLGTQGRVFVRRVDDPLPVELAERDVFVGRLTRLSELSFAPAMRRHFANHVGATHFFRPAALRAALASGAPPSALVDTTGEQVAIAPGDEIVVEIVRPGEVRLVFPRDRFPSPDDLVSRVRGLGGEIVRALPARDAAGDHGLVARFPEATRDRALSALGDLDRRVQIRAAREPRRVRLADLRATPTGLAGRSLQGETFEAPVDEIAAVATLAPVQLAEDALLLVEGDRPRAHFRTLVVVAVLAGFAVINLLALRRPA
jgi:hypothetical protein